MENTYCVYKLTSPDGKSYIGMTKHGDNPNKRWQNGVKYAECPEIRDAIALYGWNAFSKDILEKGLSQSEAIQREKYWISKFQSNEPNFGYNLASGGGMGYTHSLKTRQKISISHTGMTTSPETKEKLRQIALSRPPISEETALKHSIAATGRRITEKERERRREFAKARVFSDESLAKLAEAAKRTRNRKKRVICIETGEIFESAREASLHIGKGKNAVNGCIHAGCKCGGYSWKYLDDMGEYRMSISENNTRAGLTMPKELKAKLEELAKADNRSFNNFVVTILQNYVTSLQG